MATLNTNSAGASFTYGNAGSNPAANQFANQKLDAAKYISLYDLVNKPDNRDALIKTYGNQGITGFLNLVGATKAVATNDEVQYWEETRLHTKALGAMTGAAYVAGTGDVLRPYDVVLLSGQVRAWAQPNSAGTAVAALVDITTNAKVPNFSQTSFPIIGNLFAVGSDQPSQFIESGVVKRTNPFMIMKDVYSVTGSQATNIGWINLGNGDYRWYLKSEADTRQRFMDKREMMMLLGQKFLKDTDTSTPAIDGQYTGGDISGSEGYFSAIEDRGIVASDLLSSLSDIDDMVKILDKEGGSSEYAMYINRAQDLRIDDILAQGVGASVTTGAAAFGSFNNSPDTAISLGFRSFNRAGYTFHKHDWKLMNDPTLLADSGFAGVCVPMASVADPKTGDKAPALEMNYKAANGYSREMEHWLIGSILGASNATKDNVEFHYRSECNLITRAANRHILIKEA